MNQQKIKNRGQFEKPNLQTIVRWVGNQKFIQVKIVMLSKL